MHAQGHPISRVLLYDADCGFCQRWCAWAIDRGASHAVRFEPCQSSIELRHRAGITDPECGHSAFLIDVAADGRVLQTRRAAAAINGVLARLPGRGNWHYRLLSRLYAVPGLRQIEEAGYRWIARNRHRLTARSCSVSKKGTS